MYDCESASMCGMEEFFEMKDEKVPDNPGDIIIY